MNALAFVYLVLGLSFMAQGNAGTGVAFLMVAYLFWDGREQSRK